MHGGKDVSEALFLWERLVVLGLLFQVGLPGRVLLARHGLPCDRYGVGCPATAAALKALKCLIVIYFLRFLCNPH